MQDATECVKCISIQCRRFTICASRPTLQLLKIRTVEGDEGRCGAFAVRFALDKHRHGHTDTLLIPSDPAAH